MPTFSARLSPKSHFPGPNTGIVFGLFLSLSVFFPKSQRHPVSQTPAGLWMSRYSTPFLAYTIHLHINRILWKGGGNGGTVNEGGEKKKPAPKQARRAG